jgi:hypothetical protein
MASVNITLTVPDEHLPRLQAAMRTRFGAGLTNAEIVEQIRQNLIRELIAFTRQVEREQARIAAEQGVTLISIT